MTPQNAAGTRTDPSVSVPSAASHIPAATAAALPLDDPPASRSGCRGFTTSPWCGFSDVPPIAYS